MAVMSLHEDLVHFKGGKLAGGGLGGTKGGGITLLRRCICPSVSPWSELACHSPLLSWFSSSSTSFR